MLVLLGPALAYLLAFSLFPLLYSLAHLLLRVGPDRRAARVRRARQLQRPSSPTPCSGGGGQHGGHDGLGVVVQVAVRNRLALFFNLHLRGSWLVRGLLVLPMLLDPVVVGLMWRALLNPDWGMINWALGELGFHSR